MTNEEQFSWNALDESERVVDSVRAVAVYRNPKGDVVIRQERDWNEEEDSFIFLPIPAAEALLAKLTALLRK
jgi:hypothetical protein